MVIAPLRRKVLRDLGRLWPQVLAIALVLAAGVATMILGNGAYASLSETRARYYADYRFADVFADLTRAPLALLGDVAAIDGVLQAEARIVKLGRPEFPDMVEPASILLVSLPVNPDAGLNRLHLRQGRLPEPLASDEIVVSEGFAAAHRLQPGTTVPVVMNGKRRDLVVTGIALSPEFIYALGPGEMMPDPRRFGIAWLPRATLEAAYDLDGAFSNLVLRLAPGASETRVIEALDRLTAPYGGLGATGRSEQTSHAFLDAELKQLGAMVKVLPPIFLLVAAMLLHMTLSRLVALEREQIGLLKALGYRPGSIAGHYLEFVLCIAVIGCLIGFVAGAWLGAGMAQLYARFFSFPFLVFTRDPQIYVLAAAITVAAATGGALQTVRAVLRLAPAVAMAPPAPADFRRRTGWAARLVPLRQTGRMIARHLLRWPMRSLSSIMGVAMAVAILVASLWSFGSIDHMIDITFSRAERQDVRIAFVGAEPASAVQDVRRMPGVMAAEPFRVVGARLSHGARSKRLAIEGRPADARLSRALSPDLVPMAMPGAGLILSEALAKALDVARGDLVTVEFLEGRRSLSHLPVSGISVGYVGLGAAMEIGALNRVMGEGALISGVNVSLDPAGQDAFFAAARQAPKTGFMNVTDLTVSRFRQTLAENITVMITVYVTLAGIIAVGVVYNFSRIALSEQGRELASLRVLGFTQAEVSGVILGELAVVVLVAQPLGWLIGHGIGLAMVAAFSSDLYRVPFVMGREVYATASLIVIAAALLSAIAVRGRINRLDMIAVLKTRE
ncbi:MAG: FtsX-like permease family protein [Tabrizicola sp.]|uniref:ABC transporter permease n=1 Tax=Tabrizicola sp. TaxID=2005166 RepID=UPI002736FA87|nr:FtsX-like permease family protein [Tabrizicola sp.]MDP3264736.1 FtsX-like permease family protein [Tabrizicola sp.]MDP3649931.1 FtsX-like permease family protein [Paracoccaceae bacterium]MDZ4066452.1 FtsX-like permease family protein [Tabrizicola sp.]